MSALGSEFLISESQGRQRIFYRWLVGGKNLYAVGIFNNRGLTPQPARYPVIIGIKGDIAILVNISFIM